MSHRRPSMLALSRIVVLPVCLYLATVTTTPVRARAAAAPAATEIRWDTYGVPHILSGSVEGLFYGFGWAQMESHGNLILGLYGRARGRAAEYWGKSRLESDALVRTLDI